ncbi:MAG TPA: hypothetical protein VMU92_07905 [Acidobacteriaceae bacterium]|nr:hypothetical protein [Acidobacteriaceae bacterium]
MSSFHVPHDRNHGDRGAAIRAAARFRSGNGARSAGAVAGIGGASGDGL